MEGTTINATKSYEKKNSLRKNSTQENKAEDELLVRKSININILNCKNIQ